MTKIKSIRYGITDSGNFEAWVNDTLVAFMGEKARGFERYCFGAEETLDAVAYVVGIKTKGLKKRQRRG